MIISYFDMTHIIISYFEHIIGSSFAVAGDLRDREARELEGIAP